MAIKRWQQENVVKYGLESRVASIRVVPFKMPLEEVARLSRQKPMPDAIIEPTIEECVKAIQEDDAMAITFGCAAFRRLVSDLRRELRDKGFEIPLVNPLPLAIDVARVLIKQELSHSPLSYPYSGTMR